MFTVCTVCFAVKTTVTVLLPNRWAQKAKPETATLPSHAVNWLQWKKLLFLQFKANVKKYQAVIHQDRRERGEEHTAVRFGPCFKALFALFRCDSSSTII